MESNSVCSAVCLALPVHGVARVHSSCPSLTLRSSSLCVDMAQFICAPADGHLGGFLLGAVTRGAAVNICIPVCVAAVPLLPINAQEGLRGHRWKYLF